MKIAIDIDNTLSHTMKSFIPFLNKKYKGNKTIYDLKDSMGFNLYHTNFKEFYKDWKEFVNSKEHIEMKPIEDTIEVLKKIYKKHELFVITARAIQMRKPTILWLDKHFYGFFKEKILLEYISQEKNIPKQTKLEICKKLNIDLIIEDSQETAIDCFNNKIKVILYNHNNTYKWQKKKMSKGIIKTTSWKQIEKEIKKIGK